MWGSMGIGLGLMTDISASQEQNSVTTAASIQGVPRADLSAQQRRAISAESFRRLTALLKKPAIPAIIMAKIEVPAALPVVAPAIAAEVFEQFVASESVQAIEIAAQSVERAALSAVEVQVETPALSPELAIAPAVAPVKKPRRPGEKPTG